MRTRRSIAQIAGVLVVTFLLAGCPALPPPLVNGVVDLGPLGRYGAGGGPGTMYPNIDHLHSEPEHSVKLSVSAFNTPEKWGAFTLERHSPGSDAVLPTIGEYDLGDDGWTAEVAIKQFEHYDVTALSISELSYGAGVNISATEVDLIGYPIRRMRATFTFLLDDGEEAQGSIAVG